jgi:hypothetical protein
MKEDNNIKPLISAILNLSLKLSKCQNAKTPKMTTKTPKMTKTPKTTKTPNTPKTPKMTKTHLIENFNIAKGGGKAEFFE